MTLTKFYSAMVSLRAFIILWMVVMVIATKLFGWSLDVEFRNSAEHHSLERECDAKEVRESIERVERGEGSEADQRTAMDNMMDGV